MRIHRKILVGCLSLATLTAVVGAFDIVSESRLGQLTTNIYDQTFMAMSYLRSAQNEFSVATARGQVPDDAAARSIGADLQVARERSMSHPGAESVTRLIGELATLESAPAEPRVQAMLTATMAKHFNIAVEILAADGYHYRRTVGATVDRALRGTAIAILISLLLAFLITGFLARSIVPRLLQAFGVAEAIARGRLDNAIDGAGSDETGVLMRALATMQRSLAEKIRRINSLMAAQEASHATELAVRSARTAAALENMTQGLCMFDAKDELIIFNRRFVDMFGEPELGTPAASLFEEIGLKVQPPVRNAGLHIESLTLRTQDETPRDIAVSQQRIAEGGFVVTCEDVTERHAAEARLAYLAKHDALTGLPNRMVLRGFIETSLARVRRGAKIAVLYLNLDNFKSVNDTLGHRLGDQLLQQVAQRLRTVTRDTDIVAHLGGDEFAIVQADAEQPTDATALATRLMEVLREPFDLGGLPTPIGASIGIVVASGGQDDADALLRDAGLALGRAKADGRGVYRFFEEELDRRMRERRQLELELRRALEDDEFELHYQPLVETSTLLVQGFEALVRWRHPARGMVSPAVFIPLAEEIGLIGALGNWVLARACVEAATWPPNIKVAVNLSPMQFRDQNLASTVRAALATAGLPPARLELEITESLLLQDSDQILGILHDIRSLGVGISMDDFGTGYSSLSYLQRFPFDKIKIDQSFVRGLIAGGDCLAIVRAVIGLGRSLGMAVIAEGVENEEQVAMLTAEGCGQMQGYLFSPPRPAAEVERMVVNHLARPLASLGLPST